MCPLAQCQNDFKELVNDETHLFCFILFYI